MKPTKLYLKQHSKTGLLYFGKTVKDPYLYLGSGKRWLKHINAHGKEFIETIWISKEYTDEKEIQIDALRISALLGVGTNKELFANLIPENGINGGGDCSQMRTRDIRDKAKQTVINKYGVDHVFKAPEIRQKASKTILDRYGKSATELLNTKQSIEKRNYTNLVLYGSKCAANRDGNVNSKRTQKERLNRLVVKQLRCLTAITNTPLERGWYYKSTEELTRRFDSLLFIKPLNAHKSDIRTTKLLYKATILIRMINAIHPLKLGNNWFQIPFLELDKLLEKVKLAHPEEFDIALQTYCQYVEEDA